MAHPGFYVELNRPLKYRLRLIKRLESFGFDVEEIHKTGFRIRYLTATKFRDVCRAILSVLDPKIGSAVLASFKTGKHWRVNNRGNRPRSWISLR